jgi:hypothetical protein
MLSSNDDRLFSVTAGMNWFEEAYRNGHGSGTGNHRLYLDFRQYAAGVDRLPDCGCNIAVRNRRAAAILRSEAGDANNDVFTLKVI